ncbi:hypothetical protein NO135_22545, partial [Clostridioides difficile]|nr:hypothetical protein [Clostridioides difficile]
MKIVVPTSGSFERGAVALRMIPPSDVLRAAPRGARGLHLPHDLARANIGGQSKVRHGGHAFFSWLVERSAQRQGSAARPPC